MTPRNDLLIFTVIASEAKQSQNIQFHSDLMQLTNKAECKAAALFQGAVNLNGAV